MIEEYVEREDWARLCDRALKERGTESAIGLSAGSSVAMVVANSLSDSRRPLEG